MKASFFMQVITSEKILSMQKWLASGGEQQI
jgi:hypothetical protein